MSRLRLNIRVMLLLTVLLGGQACVRDVAYDEDALHIGGEETEVVFSIHMPIDSSNSQSSRALGDTEEKEVSTLQIMVFNADERGEYQYTTYARKVDGTSDRYVAKLRIGSYDIMMLANSDKELKTSFPGILAKGTPRDDVIRILQMEMSGKWEASSSASGYRPIPMWGVRKNVKIDKNTNQAGPLEFRLTRVLAKVNVKVALKAGHDGTFELTSVRYYNRQTKAQLIPNQWKDMGEYVTLPSLVAGNNQVEDPLIYDSKAINAAGNCENEIYIFEAPAGSDDLHPEYPCLVVGGKFNGTEGHYRIDFATKDNNVVSYMPIRRNHTYEITITSVGGEGFVDPGDAYRSRPVNIEANVIGWNQDNIGDIYFDGQHFLRLEKGRYFLRSNAMGIKTATNTLYLETDYGKGWTYKEIIYEGTPGEEWLTFNGAQKGDANKVEERWLSVTENKTNAERVAYVVITAGRIEGTIKVVQYPKSSDLTIDIYDVTMTERKINEGDVIQYESDIWTNLHPFSYRLETSHPEAEIEVYLINPPTGYDPVRFFASGPSIKGGILNGQAYYTDAFGFMGFTRQESGIFPQEALEYMFVARYEGQTVTRRFKIVHKYKDLQTTKLTACMQGRFYTIDMDYNTDWYVQVVDNDRILDTEMTSAQYQLLAESNVTGAKKHKFKVKLKVGEQYDGKKATIRFVQPGTNNVYSEFDVTSYYNYPNSYMVAKNTPITIPVTKAFRMWESEHIDDPLPLKGNYSARYLWTDFDSNYGSNLSVTFNQNTEDQSKSTITIQGRNNNYGSAIVALFLGDDIVWSWHIWIVNNMPIGLQYTVTNGIASVNFTVMERNLGAKDNRITSVNNETDGLGLYYQWGRKDPFPGAGAANGSGPALNKPIGGGGNYTIWHYDASRYSVGTRRVVPSTGNLIESIKYPYSFFVQDEYEPYDWYTGSYTQLGATLWSPEDGLKSEFDPCPDGWRVPDYHRIGSYYYYTFTFVLGVPNGTRIAYGWINTDIGNIPDSGYINYKGIYEKSGSESWLWYGYIDNDQGRYNPLLGLADMSGSTSRKRHAMPKATGMPVRCQKDDVRYWPSW